MKKYTIVFVLLFFSHLLSAQEKGQQRISWNGYTQVRFTTNINDLNSFAMRRMKLWVNSTPDFNKHWGYKIQTTISSSQNEKFMLQDVLAYYHFGNFKIKMGQFIPQYSLQRFQSDAIIPLTERAGVINALNPNGNLGVRDIGIEGRFQDPKKNFETWFGVFNGNGIKEYRIENTGIMLTHKAIAHFLNKHLNIGYSIMYREADQLKLSSILPDSVLFSGNDFRYNLFAKYQSKKFQIQAEYLYAKLNGEIANGYYILTTLNLGKNQLVASWNQYNDLIEITSNSPEVHLGYNYLFKSDKLKLMLDNGVQIKEGHLRDYMASIQIQVFFN